MSRSRYNSNTTFLDLLFNITLFFVAVFAVSFVMMNKKKVEDAKINSKAEYIITVTWPKGNTDIDTYIEDPIGNVAYFSKKQAGLLHIDQDDQGEITDVVEGPFGNIIIEDNREITSIRGIIPGEYILNVHAYNLREKISENVKIKIDKVNPTITTVMTKEFTLINKQEKTVCRFTLNKKGDIINVSDLEKSFVR